MLDTTNTQSVTLSMEDISNALPFTPYSKKHSIKEASAAIFLSAPLEDPKAFIDFVDDSKHITSLFDKKRLIRKRQQTFESANESAESNSKSLENKDTVAGFSLVQTNDSEEVLSLFQGINESTQKNYISFHELNYNRWANFKEKLLEILDFFTPLLNNYSVNAIGLTYKDEFVSNDNIPLNYESLFKNNAKYIPSIIFEDQNSDAEIALTLNMEKAGYRFLVKLNIIPTSNDEACGIQINHTAVYVVDQSSDDTKLSNIKSNNLVDILQASHDLNKDLMKSILTSEVIDRINLK